MEKREKRRRQYTTWGRPRLYSGKTVRARILETQAEDIRSLGEHVGTFVIRAVDRELKIALAVRADDEAWHLAESCLS